MKQPEKVASVVLVSVRTLWDVIIVDWQFSMLMYLTSGIKLNLFKSLKNHIITFTYRRGLCQRVIEALESVSVDSAPVKPN